MSCDWNEPLQRIGTFGAGGFLYQRVFRSFCLSRRDDVFCRHRATQKTGQDAVQFETRGYWTAAQLWRASSSCGGGTKHQWLQAHERAWSWTIMFGCLFDAQTVLSLTAYAKLHEFLPASHICSVCFCDEKSCALAFTCLWRHLARHLVKAADEVVEVGRVLPLKHWLFWVAFNIASRRNILLSKNASLACL